MARLRFSPIDGTLERQLSRAADQQPTYTDGLDPQPGFATLSRTLRLRRGELSFRRAGEIILGWEMHRRSGLRVHATAVRAEPGSTVILGLGLGLGLGVAGVGLAIPCRVRESYDEPRRIGFDYVTLPGHPECGIERFLVELAEDGSVQATVTAVSRPGTALVALGGPVSRATQRWMVNRYLAALNQQ
jgi:uncharacterized protein (UPF0548 family)